MAMNRVQFQPGLALPAFLAQYGSENPGGVVQLDDAYLGGERNGVKAVR